MSEVLTQARQILDAAPDPNAVVKQVWQLMSENGFSKKDCKALLVKFNNDKKQEAQKN